ncbi:MAG: FAD dependent oxidoreductase, partial [Planctomycetota bacterium]
MGAGRFDSDVVVIGGGPGGSATAITCASLGLRVRLLERHSFPAERPGETLHPGVEPVLAQLGVADRLASVVGSRHEGIRICWGGTTRFEPYGHDDSGPWRGYQVWRPDFDAMLLNRARELGVQVFQPCSAIEVLQTHGVVSGVQTTAGPMTAPIVVDASGRSHWLGTKLGIERRVYSPPLVAR